MNIRLEDLLPLMEDAFSRGTEFRIPITGTSMLPLLHQGRDCVTLKKPDTLSVGDIPLYRRRDGQFVLHRIVGKKNGAFICCGDNQYDKEYPVAEESIIGVVTKIERDGKTIPVTDFKYSVYSRVWTGLLPVRYPYRRFKIACVRALKSADRNDSQPQAVKSPELRRAEEYFLSLVSAAVNGKAVPAPPAELNWRMVLELARMHKLSALAAAALPKEGVPEEVLKRFKSDVIKAAVRYSGREKGMAELESALCEAGISYCFLKGANFRRHYPSPDMRFSADEDLFVFPEEKQQAEKLLLSNGYTCMASTDGDGLPYEKAPYMIVELHTALNGDYDMFADARKHLFPVPGKGCLIKMTDEDFYIYSVGHTAHHLKLAGTGVRNVLDDFLLRKKLLPECDREYIERMLTELGLAEFENAFSLLGEVWFGEGEHSAVTKELEAYILGSGVYGNESNYMLNSSVAGGEHGGSQRKFLLQRLLPPLAVMKNRYRVLKKAPVLLPLFWGVRFVSAIPEARGFGRQAKRVATFGEKERSGREAMFSELGFKKN